MTRMVSADEAREIQADAEAQIAFPEHYADDIRQRDLAHTVVQQAEQIAAVLALHQPKQDGPMSLIEGGYCSCGASEVRTMSDGYASIVPAAWPCATACALGVTR